MVLAFVDTNLASAKIHEFETTHLKTMGGTGAGGILMEESAFLNPAGIAFFNIGSVYFQRDMLKIEDDTGKIIQKPKATGVVIGDGNASLSGSLSYTKQEERNERRTRLGFTASSPLSEKSAFGASVRQTKDEDLLLHTDKKYYQTVFGVIHALDTQTSLGVVAYDPFNSAGKETKAIIGIQHIFVDYITAAFDFGGDYSANEVTRSIFYRGGLQVKVLDDFFVRFGVFKDKAREEKGNGFGLSWVQPRLSFEFALKNLNQSASVALNRNQSKIKEASFSASFRF